MISRENNSIALPAGATLLGVIVADGLPFWDPRRYWHNAVLLAVVLLQFGLAWPESRQSLVFDKLLMLFVLAVVANVFYCAAYVVDLFVQLSPFHEVWVRRRWLLLTIGFMFESILAHFVTTGMFAGAHPRPGAGVS